MATQAPHRYFVCNKQENQWCIIALLDIRDEQEVGSYFYIALNSAISSIATTYIIIDMQNAQQVKFIGPRMARLLKQSHDRQYNIYVQRGKEYVRKSVLNANKYRDYIEKRKNDRKGKRKSGQYFPQIESGNWAILVTLPKLIDQEYIRRFNNNEDKIAPVEFTQDEICEKSQAHAKYPMSTNNKAGYSAWSGYVKLVKHEYMRVSGNDSYDNLRYRLTTKGYELGTQLLEEHNINQYTHRVVEHDLDEENKSSSRKRSRNERKHSKDPLQEIPEPQIKRQKQNQYQYDVNFGERNMTIVDGLNEKYNLTQPIVLNNGKKYFLYLNIDPREKSTKKNKRIDIFTKLKADQNFLASNKVLSCGDFAWMLVNVDDEKNDKETLLLPFLVERKTWHDLYLSIYKDGRCARQKYNMSFIIDNKIMCDGRKIYLMEERSDQGVPATKKDGCEQMVVDTDIMDGFHVYSTVSKGETLRTLVNWTFMIRYWIDGGYSTGMQQFQLNKDDENIFNVNKLMRYSDFNEFNKDSLIDNLSLRLQYMEWLLTVPGCTERDAFYISKKYKTMNALLDAYDDCIEKWNNKSESEEKQMTLNLNESQNDNIIGGFYKCAFYSCGQINSFAPDEYTCPECGYDRHIRINMVNHNDDEHKMREEQKENNEIYNPELLLHNTVKVCAVWKYRKELLEQQLCDDKPNKVIQSVLFRLRDSKGNGVYGKQEPISKRLSKRMYMAFGVEENVELDSEPDSMFEDDDLILFNS